MDTELTELVEIDPTRLDGVKSPANGMPFLIMKSVSKDADKKGKINEAPDIANAEAVLRLLAQLIEAEAREMGAGCWDEVCDIEMLTSAAHTIKYFRNREQMSAESESTMKSLESAVSRRANELGVSDPMSESASKDTTEPTETAPTTEDAPVTKSTDEQIAEAVAKAMNEQGEVIKGLNETVTSLRAEMAALKAQEIPGAPYVTNAGPVIKSEQQHRDSAQLARFEELAKSTQDRELARYYADRAAELKARS
jgi:preprotein translocase subunit SecD